MSECKHCDGIGSVCTWCGGKMIVVKNCPVCDEEFCGKTCVECHVDEEHEDHGQPHC